MSEENSVEKFDPSTLMQGVKDRIKSTFVSLIPDGQWDEMVKKEVDDYFKVKDRGYNQNSNRFSNFNRTVNDLLEEETKKRMKAYLDTPEFQAVWDHNGQPACSDAVKKMIVENSGEIMTNMFGGMFTQMMQQFRNSMQ